MQYLDLWDMPEVEAVIIFKDFMVQRRTYSVKPFSFCHLGRRLPSAPWM